MNKISTHVIIVLVVTICHHLKKKKIPQAHMLHAWVLRGWRGSLGGNAYLKRVGHWGTSLKVVPSFSSLFLSAFSSAWGFLLLISDIIEQNRFSSLKLLMIFCHIDENFPVIGLNKIQLSIWRYKLLLQQNVC